MFNDTEEKKAIGPSSGGSKPVGVALYNYKANSDSPGGFKEMDLHQGKCRIDIGSTEVDWTKTIFAFFLYTRIVGLRAWSVYFS